MCLARLEGKLRCFVVGKGDRIEKVLVAASGWSSRVVSRETKTGVWERGEEVKAGPEAECRYIHLLLASPSMHR